MSKVTLIIEGLLDLSPILNLLNIQAAPRFSKNKTIYRDIPKDLAKVLKNNITGYSVKIIERRKNDKNK